MALSKDGTALLLRLLEQCSQLPLSFWAEAISKKILFDMSLGIDNIYIHPSDTLCIHKKKKACLSTTSNKLLVGTCEESDMHQTVDKQEIEYFGPVNELTVDEF
ncbi:hypothetical protein Tco_0988500 [Tanacetum coccineum]|uniref:Uncharacterized protein n=1 Tax=Tanacetum coccineum TaxID=301880 RepID=A0ABQ5ER33_9ASTR